MEYEDADEKTKMEHLKDFTGVPKQTVGDEHKDGADLSSEEWHHGAASVILIELLCLIDFRERVASILHTKDHPRLEQVEVETINGSKQMRNSLAIGKTTCLSLISYI